MRDRSPLRGALLLAGLIGAAAPANPAATPLSRDNLPWWHERHEAKLARVRQGHVDLVFLGDSITQDWEESGGPAWRDFAPQWDRFYGDRNALNLGFKGDTTACYGGCSTAKWTGSTPKSPSR